MPQKSVLIAASYSLFRYRAARRTDCACRQAIPVRRRATGCAMRQATPSAAAGCAVHAAFRWVSVERSPLDPMRAAGRRTESGGAGGDSIWRQGDAVLSQSQWGRSWGH